MTAHAARIRAARAYAGLHQEQLAERLGVDVQTIKRRESGKSEPKRGELLAIAAVCEVPTSFMENGFGEAEPSEILERLDRLEALLLGGSAVDLEPVRDYVRGVITALDEGEPGGEATQPDAQQGRGPRPPGRARPRAR